MFVPTMRLCQKEGAVVEYLPLVERYRENGGSSSD
ncbi:hypothetical protein MPNT_90079 [Candidatus Methylacidithermus pantelleriae]|uniref:Uncharacterized protein n=1 Tax=Candidatus Methylacidithermus pantelleriae TaxID=2744239 RepID=A0A8J2BT43_9BACT|nr:hypothetical protein MPNT_90079 [Candidatus Methylacidithermus pantelleriae]